MTTQPVITLPDNHPAITVLQGEGFTNVISQSDAGNYLCEHEINDAIQYGHIDIMPNPVQSVIDEVRLLAQSGKNINVHLFTGMQESLRPGEEKNQKTQDKEAYLKHFHKLIPDIKDTPLDVISVSGFGPSHLDFEKVEFWDALTDIFDHANENKIMLDLKCWASHAYLYHKYDIERVRNENKLTGIYKQSVEAPNSPLMKGVGDIYDTPVSRYYGSIEEGIRAIPHLHVQSASPEAKSSIIYDEQNSAVLKTGHLEYLKDAFKGEYWRDFFKKGFKAPLPQNAFKNNDPFQEALPVTWSKAAQTITANFMDMVLTLREERSELATSNRLEILETKHADPIFQPATV